MAVFIGNSIGSNKAFAQPSEWTWTPTNASGVVLGQATINGTPALASDWIGAFDATGNCAGAAPMIINDGLAYFNLAIYGDDATTSDLDEGITAGEPFTLRIWQALTNGEATYPNDDTPTYLDGWSNTNGAPRERPRPNAGMGTSGRRDFGSGSQWRLLGSDDSRGGIA